LLCLNWKSIHDRYVFVQKNLIQFKTTTLRKYLLKRYNSFRFAIKGLHAAILSEPHMRIHALAALLAIVAGFALSITTIEWCLIFGCIGLVFMAEVFNTAIETLTNLVSPEFNPLAGKAKDLAAGAVLIAAITAAIIGTIIFLPYLVAFLPLHFQL
jgi:diacylglycerol kinase